MKPELWKIPSSHLSRKEVDTLYQKLIQRLQIIQEKYQQVRFATSLAAEDMVITHAIASSNIDIHIFTLNTGRLHQQTIDMLGTVEKYYNIQIDVFEPESRQVEEYVLNCGLNAFYESEAAKKACCDIRKVQPLQKALFGADAWLSGQRQAQSVTRTQLDFEEHDQSRGIAKFNPIFDFSDADLWAYLEHLQVPIHPLHRMGYPSIGCEPCTRAIKSGEEIRAGRWWWLQQDSKECGLHVQEAAQS